MRTDWEKACYSRASPDMEGRLMDLSSTAIAKVFCRLIRNQLPGSIARVRKKEVVMVVVFVEVVVVVVVVEMVVVVVWWWWRAQRMIRGTGRVSFFWWCGEG